ncbi:NAD-dependent epimerase/dehydratase family protein [Aquabacterium sp.]|uniref:NAD-dependent epimerase/dehydratase family protein n=1 Tax=Aquabacterium sp. TaxID=1872578 RepID=UPI0035B3779F
MSAPRKICITGANGFIGRALMVRYQLLGSEVCGIDLHADPSRQVCAGNVAQPGSWQRQARGCDLVVHAAAVVSNSAPAHLYQSVSVGSVRHVLDAAMQGGASRFVHISSIAAYGLDFTTTRNESSPIVTLSGHPYCDAKAASEHAVLAAHAAGEIDCTIIRPGDVYGPGSRPWVLIPLELIRKNLFLLPRHGRGVFSPVYIDNLLDGIVAAAASARAAGQIFNLTDGTDTPCEQFFAHHHRWLRRRRGPVKLATPLAQGLTRLTEWWLHDVCRRQTEVSASSLAMLAREAGYSIDKARSVLGYRPAIDLAVGMARTEDWLRAGGLIAPDVRCQ